MLLMKNSHSVMNHFSSRWTRVAVAVVAAVTLGLGSVFAGTTSAHAAGSQGGGAMVNLNPGGGAMSDGSDGIQIVFNSIRNYSFPTATPLWGPTSETGMDYVVFGNRWSYNYVMPNLTIGTTAFNSGGNFTPFTQWTSVNLVDFTGSSVAIPNGSNSTPSGVAAGDATAHLQYTATKGGLDYVLDRHITYAYPNNYWTERIVVSIPAGNTDTVAYWYGGDMAPGQNDSAYGMSSSLGRSGYYSYDPTSNGVVGFIENDAANPFTSAWAGGYSSSSNPTTNDTIRWAQTQSVVTTPDFTTDASLKDAVTQIQFALGAAPGTYEVGTYRALVGFGGPQMQLEFAEDAVSADQNAILNLNIINFRAVQSSALGLSFDLPAGLTVAGELDFGDCSGATSTSTVGGSTVDVSSLQVDAFGSCQITVPVKGIAGDYELSEADVTLSGDLVTGSNVTKLVITPTPTPALPDTGMELLPGLVLGTILVAAGLVIVTRRRKFSRLGA